MTHKEYLNIQPGDKLYYLNPANNEIKEIYACYTDITMPENEKKKASYHVRNGVIYCRINNRMRHIPWYDLYKTEAEAYSALAEKLQEDAEFLRNESYKLLHKSMELWDKSKQYRREIGNIQEKYMINFVFKNIDV